MTDNDEHRSVLAMSFEIAEGAINGLRAAGERGACWQVFDSEPEGHAQPEIDERRLDSVQSREYLGQRIASGFQGQAGLCESGWWFSGSTGSTGGCVPAHAPRGHTGCAWGSALDWTGQW